MAVIFCGVTWNLEVLTYYFFTKQVQARHNVCVDRLLIVLVSNLKRTDNHSDQIDKCIISLY